MYLLSIFSPFIGAAVIASFGRFIGSRGASVIAPFSIFVSFLCSIFIWYEISIGKSPVGVYLFPWFISIDTSASMSFYFDSTFVIMASTVSLVAFCVHVYSVGYMQGDPHLSRFLVYLMLFTGFMLVLVGADSLILLLVGWEGIGVVSYLLISFWSTRLAATKSAIQAMLVNRVSDTFLIMGVFLSWWYLGSTEFEIMAATSQTCQYIDYICLCLLLGAMGKSAQIFFHVWLPNSMNGPTPVSALIHAATLVTAGVYLIARTSMIWECSQTCRIILTVVGFSTSLVTALMGCYQNDLKCVIAYSTCSQLGYMFTCLGLGDYSLAIFHLMTHAYFKALLFLTAGVCIHAVSDVQDIRLFGGSLSLQPTAFALTILGSLCLVGFPSLSGFYSKDAILELAWASSNEAAYTILMLVALLTSFYSARILYLVFLSNSNSRINTVPTAGLPFSMGLPLTLLSLCAIFIGYCGYEMLIGVGSDFWGSNPAKGPALPETIATHFIPLFIGFLPLLSAIIGFFVAVIYYSPTTYLQLFSASLGSRLFFVFLVSRMNFDLIYNKTIVNWGFSFGKQTLFIVDKGLLEFLGPRGVSSLFMESLSPSIKRLSSGTVHDYAITILVCGFAGLVLLAAGIF